MGEFAPLTISLSWDSVDTSVVVILVKATCQSWLFRMPAGRILQHSCAQSRLLCRRPLQAYLRRARVDVLHQIGDVAGIVSWLGSEESLRTAVIRELGGGQPRLRDLVNLPADLWEYTVRDLCVLHGEIERDVTALEVGHLATLRRIARPRLGLTAQVEVEVHSPRRRVRGLFPLGRLCRTNAQALGSPDPCVGPRARATSTGESTGNVYRLRQAARSRTPEDIEQVSATHHVISADMVPFPDVSLIGPHGKRLTHLNWTWLLVPEGMARTTYF